MSLIYVLYNSYTRTIYQRYINETSTKHQRNKNETTTKQERLITDSPLTFNLYKVIYEKSLHHLSENAPKTPFLPHISHFSYTSRIYLVFISYQSPINQRLNHIQKNIYKSIQSPTPHP